MERGSGRTFERGVARVWERIALTCEPVLAPMFNLYMADFPLHFAIDTAAGNDLAGDYYEFGVLKGRSFTLAYRRARMRMRASNFAPMRFVAFDSFEGLPESNDPALPSQYKKGAYAAPQSVFEANCRRAGIPEDKLIVVPGWYDELAKRPQDPRLARSKIAVCYVDCDIYESAVPVLEYITPHLQIGSVLVIDDWNRHHASERFGLRRAVKEWLEGNPRIVLTQLALTKRVVFAVDFKD
jgi:O-methyltransferase